MAMVDRYKKSGGFIQLLQVIETCGLKKREQLMKIIAEETPLWADAINNKMLTFKKIISWKPEALLEITAQVNFLALCTAFKSLSVDELNELLEKVGSQEKRRIENQMKDLNPAPNEVSSCIVKVLNETRILLSSGALKADKIDSNLIIPEDFESSLDSKGAVSKKSNINEDIKSHISNASSDSNVSNGVNSLEVDSLRKKIVELTQQLQNLKKDNAIMLDKLDKIKKIA